eukprot:2816038-Pyramimonas_sp.AAC.1
MMIDAKYPEKNKGNGDKGAGKTSKPKYKVFPGVVSAGAKKAKTDMGKSLTYAPFWGTVVTRTVAETIP